MQDAASRNLYSLLFSMCHSWFSTRIVENQQSLVFESNLGEYLLEQRLSEVGPLEAVELLDGEVGPRRDVIVGLGLGRSAVPVIVAARPEVRRRARRLEVAAPADAQPYICFCFHKLLKLIFT